MFLQVKALSAPVENRPGAGALIWEDGELSGDPYAVEAAKAVTQIDRSPEHGYEPVDWSDPWLAGQVMNLVLSQQYGPPITVTRSDVPVDGPTVEPSVASASTI